MWVGGVPDAVPQGAHSFFPVAPGEELTALRPIANSVRFSGRVISIVLFFSFFFFLLLLFSVFFSLFFPVSHTFYLI